MKRRAYQLSGPGHKAMGEVTGYEFDVNGITLVVRKTSTTWQVDEPITGAFVESDYTRAFAMDRARRYFSCPGCVDEVRRRIEAWGPPK